MPIAVRKSELLFDSSVADPDPFDADPDPAFHIEPDRIKNDTGPYGSGFRSRSTTLFYSVFILLKLVGPFE
jgi:hypothetical protein